LASGAPPRETRPRREPIPAAEGRSSPAGSVHRKAPRARTSVCASVLLLGAVWGLQSASAAAHPLFAVPFLTFYAGNGPTSVAIGDLNADGNPDLALANYLARKVVVLLGNGDGTFGTQSEYDTGSSSLCVAIGDLNGDARPDLTVANYFSNTVSVLLGNGDGTFPPRMIMERETPLDSLPSEI
jgi:hypothetical protein